MRRTLTAVTTALVAVAMLAGCSGGSSGDGGSSDGGASTETSKTSAPSRTSAAAAQTKTEACALVENELKSFIAEQTSSSAPADPAARAKLVGEFTDRLDAALPKVTNDDVHDAFEDFTEDAKEYASALTSSGSSDSAEAKGAQTDVQSSLNEVSAVCPSN
ncbi:MULTISPECIES: hypothetical protein [unclassified Curtobacterium]|uniref:hypothetical protein n=1 Tax=unclassified Curtobacterium TaxID=257496 RepID=UPI000F46FC0F|nr:MULTISPECIES: hypothetical protein [unclassified Curtobacterium]ROQ04891.1 hypothetical protein EDF41_3008 [Curtobacterium sp. PhB171]ROQ22091.1 hypothetical protein EDF40_3175 [Curtobacterium sp. PhB170]ROS33451.1 hypothetical protein EDF25_2831 [Curtobacterium sp. PhB131]ROS64771.1 hypothetical protein EDF30_3183 [Curtobacterium sp. PhB141]